MKAATMARRTRRTSKRSCGRRTLASGRCTPTSTQGCTSPRLFLHVSFLLTLTAPLFLYGQLPSTPPAHVRSARPGQAVASLPSDLVRVCILPDPPRLVLALSGAPSQVPPYVSICPASFSSSSSSVLTQFPFGLSLSRSDHLHRGRHRPGGRVPPLPRPPRPRPFAPRLPSNDPVCVGFGGQCGRARRLGPRRHPSPTRGQEGVRG